MIKILCYLEAENYHRLFSFFIDWCLNIMQKVYLIKIEGMMAIFAIVTTAATYYKIMGGGRKKYYMIMGGGGLKKAKKVLHNL